MRWIWRRRRSVGSPGGRAAAGRGPAAGREDDVQASRSGGGIENKADLENGREDMRRIWKMEVGGGWEMGVEENGGVAAGRMRL